MCRPFWLRQPDHLPCLRSSPHQGLLTAESESQHLLLHTDGISNTLFFHCIAYLLSQCCQHSCRILKGCNYTMFPVRFNYYFIQILYLFCQRFLHLFHNMFQPNFQETQHLLFVHVHTIELECYYHIIPCIT